MFEQQCVLSLKTSRFQDSVQSLGQIALARCNFRILIFIKLYYVHPYYVPTQKNGVNNLQMYQQKPFSNFTLQFHCYAREVPKFVHLETLCLNTLIMKFKLNQGFFNLD